MSSYGFAPRRITWSGWAALFGLAVVGLLILGADPAWAAAAEKTAFQKYWALGWRLVNFLILVVVIYKVAKDPARNFFRGKRLEAEKTLSELEGAKEAAQAELDALKNKLKNADQEIERLVAQLTESASRNYDRLIREAGARAEEIVAQAKVAAETELARAVKKLTTESAAMIVARAEEMLRESLTPDDHRRLIGEALDKMNSSLAA